MNQSAAAQALYPKSYKSSANSQIPGSFSPALHRAWESEAYQNLKAEHQALYDKISYFLKWNQKQKVKSGHSYISGWTRRVTAEEIQQKFFKAYSRQTINRWLKVLCDCGLLVQKFTQGKVRQFLITHWQAPNAIDSWEDNATQRQIAIAEVASQKAVVQTQFANSAPTGTSDISDQAGLLFKEETKELSSSPDHDIATAQTTDAPSSSSNAVPSPANQIYHKWRLVHKNKYIARGDFFKHLRSFEKLCHDWQGLEADQAQSLLMAALSDPETPTQCRDGKPIGSPLWLIKDDGNSALLRQCLIEIGHDLSEVDGSRPNEAQVASNKFPQERLTAANSSGFDGQRSTTRSAQEQRQATRDLIEQMRRPSRK